MTLSKMTIAAGLTGMLMSACARPGQDQLAPSEETAQTQPTLQQTQPMPRQEGMDSPSSRSGAATNASPAAIPSPNTGSSTVAAGPTTATTANKDIVRRAQEELGRKGYSVPVTGVMESRTEQALRSFQSDSGIQATGSLDKATLNALQVATGSNDNRAPASVAEPID